MHLTGNHQLLCVELRLDSIFLYRLPSLDQNRFAFYLLIFTVNNFKLYNIYVDNQYTIYNQQWSAVFNLLRFRHIIFRNKNWSAKYHYQTSFLKRMLLLLVQRKWYVFQRKEIRGRGGMNRTFTSCFNLKRNVL